MDTAIHNTDMNKIKVIRRKCPLLLDIVNFEL